MYIYIYICIYIYIYIYVFLFGLFFRCTNLMNLSTELVQLILSYQHITYITWYLIHACVCMLMTWFLIHVFSKSVLLIHVCLSEHTTWLHFTYSLGYFLTTPGLACSDLRAWSLCILPVTNQSGAAKAWIIDRPFGVISPSLSFSILEILFYFSWASTSFTLCISLYKSYFWASQWCNIHVMLDHDLW